MHSFEIVTPDRGIAAARYADGSFAADMLSHRASPSPSGRELHRSPTGEKGSGNRSCPRFPGPYSAPGDWTDQAALAMVAGLRDAWSSPSSSFDATLSSLPGAIAFLASSTFRARASCRTEPAALWNRAWRLNTFS